MSHSRDYRSFLFSATDLVHLELHNISHSGYILPETIATCISTSTALERLVLKFEPPRSRPVRERRCPPPPIRSVLPALIDFSFTRISEYLEDLVARIDALLLSYLSITSFHQLILRTPQLTQFISRAPALKLNGQTRACVLFSGWDVSCVLLRTGNKGSCWGCHTDSQIRNFYLCRMSVPRPFLRLSFKPWNTSTSWKIYIRDRVGKMSSRTAIGWNSYIHLRL